MSFCLPAASSSRTVSLFLPQECGVALVNVAQHVYDDPSARAVAFDGGAPTYMTRSSSLQARGHEHPDPAATVIGLRSCLSRRGSYEPIELGSQYQVPRPLAPMAKWNGVWMNQWSTSG